MTTLCAASDLSTALPDVPTGVLAGLPAMLTASIESYCGRPLSLAQCLEEHTPGPTRLIRLRRYPIVSVARITTDLSQVLAIRAAPGPWRASIGLAISGGYPLDTPTGLILSSTTGGVATSTPIDFGSTPTIATLAAAIAAAPGGWTAVVAPNMGPCPTSELRPTRGSSDALARPAALEAYATTLGDYELAPKTGRVTLRQGRPGPYSFPDRTYGVTGQSSLVAVLYAGGFNGDVANGPVTSPPDLIEACVLTARAALDCRDFSGIYRSVALGNTTFEAGQVLPIPPAAAQKLARFVDRRP